METIPIFIITCDRLEVLKKSMESYSNCIKSPFKIVVCDQGSTYKPTVNFLKRLGSNGAEIYWRGNVNVNEDILEAYAHLLNAMSGINVVGPMLRIDDIPKYYPLRNRLLKRSRHRDFHSREVHSVNYNGGQIRYIFAKIDTTFGMYRKGSQWYRLQEGIRILAPYSAKHLDWYIDPENLTKDQKYYMGRASRNAHWSKWS